MDTSGDTSDDSGGDGRWMTYDELAAARGIDRASAFRLALRHKSSWRRQKDNSNRVRVLVPFAIIDGFPPASPDMSGDVSPDVSRMMAAVAAVREADAATIAALCDQVKHGTEERRGLFMMIDGLRGRADRADAALSAERARSDALRDRLDAAQVRMAAAEDATEQARAQAQAAQDRAEAAARADAARRSAGVLARLRAAWRGA